MVGYKYEGVRMAEGLPIVGVTAESRTLPIQVGIILGWHPLSHNRAFRREDFELSFKDEKPTGCSMGSEIRHPYHWHVRFGLLRGEVLARNDRVPRFTTFGSHPSSCK